MPPRSMKSKLGSILYPAWTLGRQANQQILVIGRDVDFAANEFSLPIRELIKTEEYKKIFPEIKLDSNLSGKKQCHLTTKGKLRVAGAGKGVAGVGGNLVVIDDVIHEQNVNSDIERTKICKWYPGGIRQRMQPDARELVINTRWHLEDLSGYLLKLEEERESGDNPWTVLTIPAIINSPEASELLGLPEGESYWPELWSKKELLDKKFGGMTPHEWSALYMQNPVPEEGSIIKPEWIQWWPSDTPLPPVDYILISMDTAFSTSEAADYSAYSVWGIFYKNEVIEHSGMEVSAPNIVLLEADKGRWEFHELCSKVLELVDRHDPDNIIIEKKASGQSLLQEMRKLKIPVLDYLPDKDKVSRMNACTGPFVSGRVWFPNRDWATEVKTELCSFPFAPHDDMADTVSQAVNFMREGWKIKTLAELEEEWEDEHEYKPPRRTYWSSLRR